jgi:hypothetical protein
LTVASPRAVAAAARAFSPLRLRSPSLHYSTEHFDRAGGNVKRPASQELNAYRPLHRRVRRPGVVRTPGGRVRRRERQE